MSKPKGTVPFNVIIEDGSEPNFEFLDCEVAKNQVSLRPVLRAYLSVSAVSRVQLSNLLNIIGRLRGLQTIIEQYNSVLGKPKTDPYTKYVKHHCLEMLSGFGFQVPTSDSKIEIYGLASLLEQIETLNQKDFAEMRNANKEGAIIFENLGELFIPGILVCGVTGLGYEKAAFKVLECYYEEHRTLFGKEKSFHLILEFVVSIGSHFIPIKMEEVMSGWMGARARKLTDLQYYPVDDDTRKMIAERSVKYRKYGGGLNFVQCQPGSFFSHVGKKGGNGTMSATRLNSTGRIMIDTFRGATLGYYPSQALDEATNQIMKESARYKRWINDQSSNSQKSSSASDGFFVLESLPDELQSIIWPALVGFNFSVKSWGHVLVSGLSEIDFNDKAFDQLVISEEKKRLVRALATFDDDSFQDIIQGKSGGSIFLLHGPPGVGKTLTAEAIAEVLHRPLYYVSMGELGVTPQEMESRLEDVLSLCASWSALALIDEADVFMEKRGTTSDVVRNAMTCVLLRLIEYHRGLLFLTTNRVSTFDPAVESRITVALRYDPLSLSARKKIWKMLVENNPEIELADDINYDKLAQNQMNGRQIKNSVRLALAISKYEKTKLGQRHLEETIQVTQLNNLDNMNTEGEY